MGKTPSKEGGEKMTAERFVYNSEIRERKNIAHSARRKKGGSKSKKCTLPSDRISDAQKKKMNGPVETVNLNKTMSYEELKALNPSLQFMYLEHLVRNHKARRVDLIEMLGVPTPTFSRFLRRLPEKLPDGPRSKKPSAEWVRFISEANATADASCPAIEPETADEPLKEPSILAGSITICGTAEALLGMLQRLVNPAQEYRFTVSFE